MIIKSKEKKIEKCRSTCICLTARHRIDLMVSHAPISFINLTVLWFMAYTRLLYVFSLYPLNFGAPSNSNTFFSLNFGLFAVNIWIQMNDLHNFLFFWFCIYLLLRLTKCQSHRHQRWLYHSVHFCQNAIEFVQQTVKIREIQSKLMIYLMYEHNISTNRTFFRCKHELNH